MPAVTLNALKDPKLYKRDIRIQQRTSMRPMCSFQQKRPKTIRPLVSGFKELRIVARRLGLTSLLDPILKKPDTAANSQHDPQGQLKLQNLKKMHA